MSARFIARVAAGCVATAFLAGLALGIAGLGSFTLHMVLLALILVAGGAAIVARDRGDRGPHSPRL